jgi:hypothetical protein
MNEIQMERFNEAYWRFQAGQKTEALTQIRELAQEVKDPLDLGSLLYHETFFLLEMNEPQAARDRLKQFQSVLAPLASPPDTYDDTLRRIWP